ncbi:MAG: response regulator [Ruminiclostridium sp.]|nr:response regulator [Ruminiclostridium sp.]
MYSVLIIIHYFGIMAMALEMVFVLMKRTTRMKIDLLCLLAVISVTLAAYTLEMQSTCYEEALLAKKFEYLGKPFITLFMLFLLLDYCRIFIPKGFKMALVFFQCLETLVVFSAEVHMLYYSSIGFTDTGLFPHLVLGRDGPLYIFFMILLLLECAVMMIICIRQLMITKSKAEKKQILLFVAIILIPVICLFTVFFNTFGNYDATMMGYLFAAAGFSVSFSRFDLLNAITLAKDQATEYTDSGLIVYDSSDRQVYINSAAEKLGIAADIKKIYEKNEPFFKDDKTYFVYCNPIEKDGVCYGNMYLIRDMTDIYRYEQQLREEKQRADEANNAKSEFLASMSHELRTPMNAVVGMTEVLLRDEDNEQKRTYLKNIMTASTSLLALINDLLDFTKLGSGKFVITEGDYRPEYMIDGLKPIFEQRIGTKPIKMIYDIDPALPAALRGDDIRIKQVIINLVNNAIKYTDKGSVTLTLKVLESRPGSVIIKYSVTDTGIGIKQEDMGKLFEAFTQVDVTKNRKKEGTGLGLTICHQLVTLMGGEIKVESEYGVGSCFWFTLEQKSLTKHTIGEKKLKPARSSKTAPLSPVRFGRILIVDDAEMNREVIKALLAPYVSGTDEAENGEEAVKMISENKYDIVLMDHMMPIMDGIEAAKKIRSMEGEYYKKLPIIALSASDSPEKTELFLEAGMDAAATKPVVIKELLKLMQSEVKKRNM